MFERPIRSGFVALLAILLANQTNAQATPIITSVDVDTIIERCEDLETDPNHGVEDRIIERFSIGNVLSISVQEAIEVTLCLEALTGDDWAYNPVTNRFVTGSFVGQADRFFENELAEYRQRALAQEVERLRAIAEAERVRTERLTEVYRATVLACEAMYQEDVVTALTNPVCHPIFLEIGLPE